MEKELLKCYTDVLTAIAQLDLLFYKIEYDGLTQEEKLISKNATELYKVIKDEIA